MIINWLLYSLLATTILVAAGFAFEYAARALRTPTRWIWLAVMVLSTSFSAATLVKQLAPVEAPANVEHVYDYPGGVPGVVALPKAVPGETKLTGLAGLQAAVSGVGIVGVDESSWVSFDAPLLMVCGALAVFGLIALCVTVARLNGVAHALNNAVVEGVPVLLSRDIGPALLGVFRFRVVLPRWVIQMPSSDLRTILKHEQEHAIAGDPTLTLGALFITALQPWNPAMWLALSRLRFSIESDCDARVLGANGDAREYGKLLVSVYERTHGGLTPLTALVTRTSQLEARIRRMVDKAPRSFSPKTAGALAMAFMLSAFAYSLEVTAQKSTASTPTQPPPVARRKAWIASDSATPDWLETTRRRKNDVRAAALDTPPNPSLPRKRTERLQADTPPTLRRKVDSSASLVIDDYKTRRVDSLRREYEAQSMRDSSRGVVNPYRKLNASRYKTAQGGRGSANNLAAARKQYANVLTKAIQDSVNRANRQPAKRGSYVFARPVSRADSLRNEKARAAYDVMTPEERRGFEQRVTDMRRAKRSASDTMSEWVSMDSAPARGSRASIKPYASDSAVMRGRGGAVMRMPDTTRLQQRLRGSTVRGDTMRGPPTPAKYVLPPVIMPR